MGWDQLQLICNTVRMIISLAFQLQALANSDSVPMVCTWNELDRNENVRFRSNGNIVDDKYKKDCENFVHIVIILQLDKGFYLMRAQLIHGENYFQNANKYLSFAMIETKQYREFR